MLETKTDEVFNKEGLKALKTAVTLCPALKAKVDMKALLVEVDTFYDDFNQLETFPDFLDFMKAWHERIIACAPNYKLSHWDSALSARTQSYDAQEAYSYIFNRATRVTRKQVAATFLPGVKPIETVSPEEKVAQVIYKAKSAIKKGVEDTHKAVPPQVLRLRDFTETDLVKVVLATKHVALRYQGHPFLKTKLMSAILDVLIKRGCITEMPVGNYAKSSTLEFRRTYNTLSTLSTSYTLSVLDYLRDVEECDFIPVIPEDKVNEHVRVHSRHLRSRRERAAKHGMTIEEIDALRAAKRAQHEADVARRRKIRADQAEARMRSAAERAAAALEKKRQSKGHK